MNKAADDKWEDRLQAWAEYMLSGESGSKVKISGAYSMRSRGGLQEGDGIPIHVGEALDTHELYRKLAEHLRAAVWAWYVETGSAGDKAQRLAIHRDTLTDRVTAAKVRLEDLHRARNSHKSKTLHGAPKWA